VVGIAPPPIVTEAQIDNIVDILDHAQGAVEAEFDVAPGGPRATPASSCS
jgi:hypothetical protein